MKIIKKHHDHHPKKRYLTLGDYMDQMFNDSLWDPFGFWESDTHPIKQMESRFMPSMDISEDDKELKVEANIPGFDPKNIEMEIDDNILTISGKTEHESEDKNRKYYRKERAFGEFHRQIALPQGLDTEKAEADSKNGTLTITIPKLKDNSKKKFKINLK